MTSNQGKPDPQQTLEAYLDGTLDTASRQAFEQQLADDPALAEAVRLQSSINRSLHHQFAPPDFAPILDAALADSADQTEPAGDRAVTWWRRPAVWRIAAMLLLAAAAVAVIRLTIVPKQPISGYEHRSFATVYRDDVQQGLTPDWVCETDKQFADTFAKRLGTPLLLGDVPAKVEAIGLSYAYTISRRTTYLLAKVDGKPVLVFIDLAKADADHTHEPGRGMHLHRRTLDDLVLYELSPWQSPHLLEHFYIPPGYEQP